MLIHIRRALGAIFSVSNLNVIFIKKYIKIFHIVYEGNLLSFQSKKSLDRSASMGEVDDLSLILIYLNVQRSHHDSIEVRPRCSFLSI
jgi:hypothetical protein